MTETGSKTQHRHQGPGKVLSFEQKGEFFYKRGLDKLDDNDLPNALSNYRMALERDPENEEIRLAAAEVLTEMERFDESNRILFRLMENEQPDAECFFGLGCNFAGLNDLDHAKDALERYAELEPEGEFIYDAYDMLDAIDDAEYDGSEDGLVELNRKDEALDLAEDGRELIEQEHYSEAEEKLRRALALDPELDWARNNLTLVYFCRQEYKRAVGEANKVLERDANNMQALCNLAMIQSAMHDTRAANSTADRFIGSESDDPDDANRMALVLMDLGRFADAYPVMLEQKDRFPYDEGTLHRFAMCAYETDRFDKALACYDTLLKINSRDTVARYYRGVCRAAEVTGSASPAAKKKYMLNYQVPFDEMLARINRLNELVAKPKAELDAIWQAPGELTSLVCWGFSLPDDGIKRALISLVSSFADSRSEDILRDFILRRDQSDALKHEAFAMLAAQGAKEPYIAYLSGSLVESRVSRDSEGVSKPYRDALITCLSTMNGRRSDKAAGHAVLIWEKLIRAGQSPLPRITRAQSNAMAAALEYLACRESGEKASKSDICAKYGVSALRFKNALARLDKK